MSTKELSGKEYYEAGEACFYRNRKKANGNELSRHIFVNLGAHEQASWVVQAFIESAVLTRVGAAPEGWKEFIEYCASCHGKEINGNRLAIQANSLLAKVSAPASVSDSGDLPEPAIVDPGRFGVAYSLKQMAEYGAKKTSAARHAALEDAAKTADSFTCGTCGMDGKAGNAIRSLIYAAPTQSTQQPDTGYFGSETLATHYVKQPDADKDRLLAALERAAAAEDALRALTDECNNDAIPGWEDRMQACIERANRILAPQATQQPDAGEPPLKRESQWVQWYRENKGVSYYEARNEWERRSAALVPPPQVAPMLEPSGNTGELPQVAQGDEPLTIADFTALIDDYQCAQKDGSANDRANARIALMNAYRSALSRQPSAGDAKAIARLEVAALQLDAVPGMFGFGDDIRSAIAMIQRGKND
jgi:hypothetical protein